MKKLVFDASRNFKFTSELLFLEEQIEAKISRRIRSVFIDDYDTLIVYNSGVCSIVVCLLGLARFKKVIYCFHEPFYTFSELRDWGILGFKYLFVNLTHIVVANLVHRGVVFSNYGEYKLRRIAPKHLEIVKSGLAIGMRSITTRRSEKKTIKISYLGSINQYKSPIPFLNEYYRFFNDLNISYTLYTQEFDKLQLSHYPKVNYRTDKLDDKEFDDIICQSDFIHIPHKNCTQSGILMRALSRGTPVIVNNTENYKHEPIIHGYCGIILDGNFVENFREMMNERAVLAERSQEYFSANLIFRTDAFEI